MKRALIPQLMVSILLLAACKAVNIPAKEINGQKIAVSSGSYTNVRPNELNAMLANKDFTFVNVHIPFEGKIGKTDVSIPYDQIEQNSDKLPAARDVKIVLYCRSGRMSSIAAGKLAKLGYTNIWNLDGGMVAWEKAGFPIER